MVEFAILLIVICSVLIGIGFYLKKSAQGRIKLASDSLGEQFSPSFSNLVKTTNYYSSYEESIDFNGESRHLLLNDEYQKTDYFDDFSHKSLKEERLWQ